MGDQQKSKNYFFANLLDKIGLTTPPTVAREQIAPAPPQNAPYPTTSEAIDAVKAGFGYGSGNEPYIQGKTAEIYDERTPSGLELGDIIAAPSSNVDMTKFKNLNELDKVRLLHAQAALAVNRHPIAALGYDPQKFPLQTKSGKSNLGGAFDPEQDRGKVNIMPNDMRPPSTMTHESLHRGLAQLREHSPEARALLKKLPFDEENTVRYLMATTMGDPELGRGDVADAQRAKALKMFEQQDYFYRDPLRKVTEIAAELRKNRRPGGPR